MPKGRETIYKNVGNKIDITQESATSVIAIDQKSVIGRLTADKDGREMNMDVHPLYKTMEEDIKNDMRQKALEWGIL